MKSMIDIIVVNWNSGDFLPSLVASLENTEDKKYIASVIIVDNASTDDSLQKIKDVQTSFRIEVIESNKNLGFAKACNLGARKAQQKYILFLNPDTKTYARSIQDSVEFLDKDTSEEYGACGIQLVDELNIPNRSCARIPSFSNFVNAAFGFSIFLPKYFPGILEREWKHNQTKDVGHVIGAFYMIRRSLFEKIGGFDERFFLYYEDLDLSTRLKSMDRKIAFLSEVRAIHIGGGCSRSVKVKRLCFSYISKLKYILKHFPIYQSVPLAALVVFVEPITRFFFYFLQLSFKEALMSLLAYFQFLLWPVTSVLRGSRA